MPQTPNNKENVSFKDENNTRVFLAPGGGNQYLKANFLHGGLFGSIDDWVKFPRISLGRNVRKTPFSKWPPEFRRN